MSLLASTPCERGSALSAAQVLTASRFLWAACLLALVFLLPSPLAARSTRPGFGNPILQHYPPEVYGGSGQVFGVAQAASGEIVIADVADRSLFLFDGATWRALRIERPPLALAADSAGRVWVAASGDIGELETVDGVPRYRSLGAWLPPEHRGLERFDDVVATPLGPAFAAGRTLLIWDTAAEVFGAWQLPEGELLGRGFWVHGRLLLSGRLAIYELAGDRLVPLAGIPSEVAEATSSIAELPGSDLLLLVRPGLAHRAYRYAQAELSSFSGALDRELGEHWMADSLALPNGNLALATFGRGALIVDQRGELLYRIDRLSGTGSDDLYRLIVDRDGSLWVAEEAGVSVVHLASPAANFGRSSALGNNVTALSRLGDELYLGTLDGLFRWRRDGAGSAGRFELVDAVPAVDTWFVGEVAARPLVINDSGVFALDVTGDAALDVAVERQVYHLGPLFALDLPVAGRVLFLGNQRLEVADTRQLPWQRIFRYDLPGYADSAVAESDRVYWIFGSGGLTRAEFHDGFDRPPEVARFRADTIWYGALRLDGELVLYGQRGAWRLVGADSALESAWQVDERLGQLDWESLLNNPSGYGLELDPEGRLWSVAGGEARRYRVEGGLWAPEDGAVGGSRLENVFFDPNEPDLVWIAHREGLLVVDGGAVAQRRADVRPIIRRPLPAIGLASAIESPGGRLPNASTTLPYQRGVVRFEVGAPYFQNEQLIEYRMRLTGFDDAWTPWSREARKDYTRLPEGDYSFEVEARHLGAFLGQSAMPLTILPPWYRSWWALALGFLAGLGAVALAAWSALRRPRQREQRLSLEKQRLERLVAERTSELANANRALERAAVTDLLTGLHNRRYLDERLPSELALLREERAGGLVDLVHGVLMADLDHFKQINDELGHVAGDRVLEATAALLRQQCRDDDLVVRWGGEEFLIVLRSVSSDEVARVAERIRAAFEDIRLEGSPRAVTCSLGFALLPLAGASNETLDVDAAIDLADRCLYLAKQGGRNAWVGIVSEAGRQALLEERRGVAEVAEEVRGAVVYRFAPRAA